MQRRALYHHHVLRRPKSELIGKVYHAQKIKPSKGDFIEMIESDKKLLKNKLSDDKILRISKYKYKKIIKVAIANEAFQELMRKKESNSIWIQS